MQHTSTSTSTTSSSSTLRRFATAALATSSATLVSHPIDLVKVRLQLQRLPASGFHSSLATAAAVVRAEGAMALYKGLSPALARAVVYGSLRLGLYEPFKQRLQPYAPSTTSAMLAASLLSGGVAAAAANPLEAIKVRMQASSAGARSSLLAAVRRDSAAQLLLAGLGPHLARGAVNTCAQLVSYDWLKHRVVASRWWERRLASSASLLDELLLQVGCALVSGVVTTTVTVPIDLCKTFAMNAASNERPSVLASVRHLVATDGARGLLKSWVPTYARLAPHTLVMFLVYEAANRLLP